MSLLFVFGRGDGSSGRRCQSREAFRMRLHRAQTAHVMHMQAKNADRASMVPLWRAILYHPSLVDFVP